MVAFFKENFLNNKLFKVVLKLVIKHYLLDSFKSFFKFAHKMVTAVRGCAGLARAGEAVPGGRAVLPAAGGTPDAHFTAQSYLPRYRPPEIDPIN